MSLNVWKLSALSLWALLAAHSAAQPAPEQGVMAREQIKQIAISSSCRSKNWADRGLAPSSYIQGVALVFARALCHADLPHVPIATSAAIATNRKTDALAHYESIFQSRGMSNSVAGADTLRHSFVLLIGLGMRESSGKYCEGRDVSQCFNNPETAEAGLFQTSYGARKASPALTELIQHYSANQDGCMLSDFKGPFSCPIRKSHNATCPDATSATVGQGPGAAWQDLTKSCPAFAVEYASVVLRKNGGQAGEFGPIRKMAAEVSSDCDSMLKQVQSLVAQQPAVCQSLNW